MPRPSIHPIPEGVWGNGLPAYPPRRCARCKQDTRGPLHHVGTYVDVITGEPAPEKTGDPRRPVTLRICLACYPERDRKELSKDAERAMVNGVGLVTRQCANGTCRRPFVPANWTGSATHSRIRSGYDRDGKHYTAVHPTKYCSPECRDEARRERRRTRRDSECGHCGERFEHKRIDQRYCSNRCRQAAHRARHRQAR